MRLPNIGNNGMNVIWDSKEYIKSSNPYEIDWEEQAEIECRGNIEW